MEPEEVGPAADDRRAPAETWEVINRTLLASAAEAKLERGTMVRLDSTVTAALVHESGPGPRTSSLLWDAVRVMTRLLREAKALGAGLVWRDRRRAAKRRARDTPAGGPDGCSSTAS